MTEREKLVDNLSKTLMVDFVIKGETNVEDIANWVMEDRKRICAPLMVMLDKDFPKLTMNGQLNTLWRVCEETLKLAGLEKE